jgi:AcrR family transcriptional regulator
MAPEPLTPTDYFEEALRLLARGGAKLVTIANLCEALQVTKGSFYHHFKSGPEFLRQVLAYWESAYADQLIAAAAEVDDPTARVAVLTEMASNLHHEAETAIRALARSEPFAAAVQRRVDERRMQAVLDALLAAGFTTAEAERYARMSLALLVGAQHVVASPDRRSVQQVLEAPADLLTAMLSQRLPTT